MRINGVSNKTLTNNNVNNNPMSPLEKQKQQLQQQMKKIQESNMSKEDKAQAVKDIEDKIKDIEQQLAEEKAVKSAENLEKDKEKVKEKQEEEEEKRIEEQEKNGEDTNTVTVNKDTVVGLVSASYHQRLGKVAYSVYRVAKAKGDMSTANRALMYTGAENKKSLKSKKLIQKGIEKYKQQLDNAKKDDNSEIETDKAISKNGAINEASDTSSQAKTEISAKKH